VDAITEVHDDVGREPSPDGKDLAASTTAIVIIIIPSSSVVGGGGDELVV